VYALHDKTKRKYRKTHKRGEKMRTKNKYHEILGLNVTEKQYFKLVELAETEKRDIKRKDVLKIKGLKS
jgi:hypothetical protein